MSAEGPMAAQVYTDPDTPGAPQVGDLVVVVTAAATDAAWRARYDGTMGVLHRRARAWSGDDRPWQVVTTRGAGPFVHAVRRPTEAELASWALAQHHGAP